MTDAEPATTAEERIARGVRSRCGPSAGVSTGAFNLRSMLAVLLAWVNLAADPIADPDGMDEGLATMTLSLTASRPYRFVLSYHGGVTPFHGRVCYWFAGYNETCMDPKLAWLTPATRIELYAPGGVPRDLLEGYLMLVRYPAVSERTFRYLLEAHGR